MQFRVPPDNTTTPVNNHAQPGEHPNTTRVQVEVGDRVATSLILDADRIIITFDCNTVKVYSALTGALLQTLDGHQGGVWASALYNSNTLVTAATDRTLRVWDLEKGVCTHVFRIHTSTVRAATIVVPININRHNPQLAPKYEPEFPIIIAGSRDSTLSVWRLPVQELNDHLSASETENWLLHRLEGHTQEIREVAAEGNLVVSASYDFTARIWNSHTGELVHTLVGHQEKLYQVVLDTANHQCFTTGLDATIRVWSLNTGSCLHTITGHAWMVGLLRLNDDLLVLASGEGTVKVWDPTTANLLHTFGNHSPGTGPAILAIQHDDKKLVTGAFGLVQTWDIRTGELLDQMRGVDSVWQVAFDRRRRVVAFNLREQSAYGQHAMTYLEILDYGVDEATQETQV
ncbi:SCF ubiquitin ligase complex subunit cdc4 [Mortierella hygrophila]|uniref:SCF ubiquitin ligase complex subunit cdc4 n=1 Tax=Mortierella hygrophila TaxID=979708 RepID=A0A9P6F1M7_9FUNG|nr:SCF ubiquitin ligase complex subunit cdc4 [Mortierella hygrophila]